MQGTRTFAQMCSLKLITVSRIARWRGLAQEAPGTSCQPGFDDVVTLEPIMKIAVGATSYHLER